jgi:hypothetical protein
MPRQDPKPKPSTDIRPLLIAASLDAACTMAGVLGFILTGKLIWVGIGVLAGAGFAAPAVIRFLRQAKDRDRASR